MLLVKRGQVHTHIAYRPGVQTVAVIYADGTSGQALFYCQADDQLAEGESVFVNCTAVELGLGTGGYDMILARCGDCEQAEEGSEQHQSIDRGARDYYPTQWGHVMKMRYTPWQLAVDMVEEQNSPHHHLFAREKLTLERTPVIVGELHSLLPLLSLTLHALQPDSRLVYVMPDAASLPIALSRHVHQLQQMGILAATVTAGHAWGGDYETVNVQTGLLAAKHLGQADFILCMLGPGVAGTGTPYGFSGLQLAEVLHAANILDGIPIYVPRISFADQRSRHYGISHHTLTTLGQFTLTPVIVPLPLFSDHREQVIAAQLQQHQLKQRHHCLRVNVLHDSIEPLQQKYWEPLVTMGRDLYRDPAPLITARAAANVAVFSREWQRQQAVNGMAAADALATLAAAWDCRASGAN